MARPFPLFSLAAILLLAPATMIGQGVASPSEPWTDYVSGDYDIQADITYATANGTELKLDLYVPRNRSRLIPTLLLFHGGGWVAGRKESNVLQLLPYLSMGWAAANVEYRLGQVSPAPAAVEDCRCALRWVVQHAKNYSLDTARIVLTGGSAGGHLALITGMLPPGNPFDRQCPTDNSIRWGAGTEPEVKVAAIVNWFGITDVAELLDGPDAKHYAIEWLGSLKERQEIARQVSPITYVRPGIPPVITLHGDRDDIVPYTQAVRLHAALDKAGVPNSLITVSGAGHGGFSKQQLVDGFTAIREFLRKNGVLKAQ